MYDLIQAHEFVEFLVGRDGEFDQIVSSAIKRVKRRCGDEKCALTLVLPYMRAEYSNNADSFEEYYDSVEVCEESAAAHPKGAIQIRNRYMVDRSDLVVCYIDHNYGGAYKTIQYARKQEKQIINISKSQYEPFVPIG